MAKSTMTKSLEKTELLFINQDEKSLSKNKHVTTTLRAHIMRDYARKKAVKGIQRIKQDTTAVDSFMGRTPKPKQIVTSEARADTLPIRSPPTQQNAIREISTSTESPDEGTERNRDTSITLSSSDAIITLRKPQTSPTTYLSAGAGDPFFSSVVQVDSFTSSLMHYYAAVLLPALYAKERNGVRVKAGQSGELQKAFSDSGEMYAVLAMASAHQDSLRRGNAQWQVVPRDQTSLYFKTKCIQAIQKNLNGAPNDVQQSMIRAAMRLSYAESVSGNFQAQLMHQRAMYRLVDMRGGLETLDEPWPESIIMTDIKSAIVMLSQPYFKLTWSPVDLPRETACKIIPGKSSELMAIGCRLFDAEFQSSSVFHPRVRDIFQDLRQVVHLAEYAAANIDDMEWSDLKWMTVKTLAVEHRLLSMVYDSQLQAETPDQGIQACCRIATILYTNTTLLNNIPLEILRYLIPRLLVAFSQTELKVFWSPYADILLWVLCIGAHAAETTPDEEWFLEHMVKTAEFLLIRDWEEVRSLLTEFFYLKRVHEVPLERLWKKVQLRIDAEKVANVTVMTSV